MASIEIINDHHTVLIDDNYRNMTLHSKGKSVVVGNIGGIHGRCFDLDVPNDPRIFGGACLALKSPHFTTLAAVWSDGGNTKYRVYVDADVGTEVDWYIFTVFEAAPVPDGIVTLRNAEGFVTFNSDAKYFRVRDFVVWDYAQQFSKSYVPGREYALVTCSRVNYRVTRDTAPGGWNNFETMGARVQGTTVSFGKWQQRVAGAGSMSGATFSGGIRVASLLVVDVTGL